MIRWWLCFWNPTSGNISYDCSRIHHFWGRRVVNYGSYIGWSDPPRDKYEMSRRGQLKRALEVYFCTGGGISAELCCCYPLFRKVWLFLRGKLCGFWKSAIMQWRGSCGRQTVLCQVVEYRNSLKCSTETGRMPTYKNTSVHDVPFWKLWLHPDMGTFFEKKSDEELLEFLQKSQTKQQELNEQGMGSEVPQGRTKLLPLPEIFWI